MTDLSYLQLTESTIRKLKNKPNENYSNELREDYFGTIMKVFNIYFTKNIKLKLVKSMMSYIMKMNVIILN